MEIINVTEQTINVNPSEDIIEVNVTEDIIEVNVTEEVINVVTQTGAYPLPSNVFSVFGRVGNVVGQDGDYTTSIVAEGTNLYYTNARSRAAISENITGINYDSASGIFTMASGYSIATDATQATWTAAYNDKINSASVSGTTTKTLTLNQQDGGTITTSWTDDNTDAVTSVFGRTGAVTAQSGDYTSLQVTENTNLYYTDQRARFAISGDTNSGVVYQNTTGIIALDDIPNTSLLNDKVTINSKNVSLGGSLTLTTTDVAEGTNLYFTNARAQNALTYGNLTSGDLDVSGGTAAVIGAGASMTLKTVNANVGTYGSSTAIPVVTVNGKGLVTALTTTAVSIPSGALNFIGDVTGSGTTGSDTTLTLATVNANVGEYGDNVTIPTITINAKGLVTAASETAIPTASGSTTGLLTSTNWTTFNNKQEALNGTGFVKASGTTISYDNSTYLTSVSGITAGGELSGTYPNPTLVNSAVTGKILSGVNITGGTIQDTDSILTAFGKVQNQINGLIGGSIYRGTWNATTNTPTITSSVGTKGDYYIVSVSGTTTINGISDWNVGDWAIYDGTAWQQVDNTDAVVSVNGYTGAVSLTTTDITEGTNQYFTTTRARAANSAGTGISYSGGVITNTAPDQTVSLTSGTGISATGTYPNFTITNTAPDQTVALTGAGTTSISGTYPNFTITSNDQYVGTVTSVSASLPISSTGGATPTLSITQANTSTDGYLSSTDWNTFNNKVSSATLAGYVPYTGATTNVNLGTHSLTAADLVVNHTSGSGVAASITKGGNGEALTVVKSSGSGNAASITGGVTLLDELHLTTDLADTYIASATTWNAKQNAITLTTTGNSGASTFVSNTLNIPTYTLAGLGGINLTSLSATSPLLYDNTTGVFSIQQSSGSQAGFLAAADWTTFNGKIGGSGTTNYVAKFSASGTMADSLIFDNGTNVGIGTTTINEKLDVEGSMVLRNSGTYSTSLTRDIVYRSSTSTFGIQPIANIQFATVGNAESEMRFVTRNGAADYAARMTISKAGNVGIGTSSPSNFDGVSFTGPFLDVAGIMQIKGTSANTVAALQFGGSTYRKALIYSSVGTDDPYLAFGTASSGSSSSAAERMRITSGGQVLLHSTTFNSNIIGQLFGNSGDTYFTTSEITTLVLNRQTTNGEIIRFQYNGSTVGSISTNSNSLPSDLNFKKDITDLSLGLNLVSKLRPVHYRHKMDNEDEALSNGIIAQELEESLLECGIQKNSLLMLQHKPNDIENESQYWVDYTKMIPILVKAIQELKAEIDQLKNK
jgi:hypothetical protein